MNRYWQWLALLCLLFQASVPAANELAAGVQQPARDFGYSVGDVLEQRISLDQPTTDTRWLDGISLQREGKWIERQSATITDDTQSLVLQYQIVNAPTRLVIATLPELAIPLDEGLTLKIESWPFSIAPLIPAIAEQSAEQLKIQADSLPLVPDNISTVRNLQWLVAALIATLVAWLFWWFWQNRYDAVHLPFAQASLSLKKLARSSINDTPEAWIIMHRAFDQTAGRTVSIGSVDEFIQDISWLQPMNERIRAFYTDSGIRFYSESSQIELFDLSGLCKALYQAEKRHVSTIRLTQGSVRKAA